MPTNKRVITVGESFNNLIICTDSAHIVLNISDAVQFLA